MLSKLTCLNYNLFIESGDLEIDFNKLYTSLPDLEVSSVDLVELDKWQMNDMGEEYVSACSVQDKLVRLGGKQVSDWDFSRVGAQVINLQAEEEGNLMFHSSAVSKDGRGILFLGDVWLERHYLL